MSDDLTEGHNASTAQFTPVFDAKFAVVGGVGKLSGAVWPVAGIFGATSDRADVLDGAEGPVIGA